MQEQLAQLPVSAQHFLSTVDGWLNMPHPPLHPPFCSTTTRPSCRSINPPSNPKSPTAEIPSHAQVIVYRTVCSRRLHRNHWDLKGKGLGMFARHKLLLTSLVYRSKMVSLSYMCTPLYLIGLSMPTVNSATTKSLTSHTNSPLPMSYQCHKQPERWFFKVNF